MSQPARVEDIHDLAAAMPHVTVVHGRLGNPVYQVGGKSFVFFRTPRPDAFDPDTGQRYDDVIVFWVGSEGDKQALLQDPNSPFFTTKHFDGHPSVLLRAARVGELSKEELTELVQDAWLAQASARRRNAWLSTHGPEARTPASDDLLAGQIDYYRARAKEYDETAYGDLDAARARIARVLATMQPAGRVLEIACGTGMWTEALAHRADQLTAIDSAAEAVAIARARVDRGEVDFEVTDVFTWRTSRRFDVIFFSAWLSHVPASRFDEFWQLLRQLLADGGRVLFVDEHVDEQAKERYLTDGDEVVERRLNDGTRYRIVKNFIDPDELAGRLDRLGWECRIERDGTDWVWVLGEARPAASSS